MNRRVIGFLSFGSVTLQTLYAYFAFTAIEEGLLGLAARLTEVGDRLRLGIWALSALLTFSHFLQDLLSVNPAETTYALSQRTSVTQALGAPKQRPHFLVQLLVEHPLKWFSLLVAYTCFILNAGTTAIAPASFIPITSLRWSIASLPILMGAMHYVMLSHQDVTTHNRYIYERILNLRFSVVVQLIRRPLISLELLMNLGSNALLRGGVLAYITVRLIDAQGTEPPQPTVPILVGVIVLTSFYTVFFTRFRSSIAAYDSVPGAVKRPIQLRQLNWINILTNTVLRGVRSFGLLFGMYRIATVWLPSPSNGIIAGAGGMIFLLHGVYMSYQRAKSQLLQRLTQPTANGKIGFRPFVKFILIGINLTEKISSTLIITSAFQVVNEKLQQHHVFTALNYIDTTVVAISLCVPVMITSFDYYQMKLADTVLYYYQKFQIEREQRQYGWLRCWFVSTQDYDLDLSSEGSYREPTPSRLLQTYDTATEHADPLGRPISLLRTTLSGEVLRSTLSRSRAGVAPLLDDLPRARGVQMTL